MPIVRGQFIPELTSAGRIKKTLDVLLWADKLTDRINLLDLNEIEILREYLRSIQPAFCDIRLLVQADHRETIDVLRTLNVRFTTVGMTRATAEMLKMLDEEEVADAAQTALTCDADALVVTNSAWLPYSTDLENAGLFLTDTSFLKRYCEIFVRGHDVPWAFGSRLWNQPWNGFYHMTEVRTLGPGLDFLYEAQKRKVNAQAQETVRSLVHNRLPNICFTRDRLLFYMIQKKAAQRARWRRQEFAFEVGYYLNFYYPLIFGGFDHVALLVSQCLGLGIPEKNVGAGYSSFLDALKIKSEPLYKVFTDPKQVEFFKRVSYLRHYASHRGSLAPAKLLEKPDRELTNDELDAMISDAGMDYLVAYWPKGEMRDHFREMMRYKFRMERYEQEGKVLEGVVPIMIDGKAGFIMPLNDTTWTFERFIGFVNSALTELKAAL